MKMVSEATVSTIEEYMSQAFDGTCFWILIFSFRLLNPTLDLGKECYQEKKYILMYMYVFVFCVQ